MRPQEFEVAFSAVLDWIQQTLPAQKPRSTDCFEEF
jgi:hypothetical protein